MLKQRRLSAGLLAAAASLTFVMVHPVGRANGPTEAPTGFDTQTNGFEHQEDHNQSRKSFEEVEGVEDGLGPIYNGTSCVACHQNPVTGGSTQTLGTLAGHFASGNFVPAVLTNGRGTESLVAAPNGLIMERAVCPEAQVHVPESGEPVRSFRKATSLMGLGYVEAIDDATIGAVAAAQPGQSNNRIAGQVAFGIVFETGGAPAFRVGRFTAKNDFGSILSGSAFAYFLEMGITNRLFPTDLTSMCDTVSDPEDSPHKKPGSQDIDLITNFLRGTKAPPRDSVLAATPDAQAGSALFGQIGCAVCHVTTFVTAPAGTLINAGTYTIPPALGDKIIHPYSDFLLHDIGTGDGIAGLNPGSANKFRTSPLWGLRTNSRLMHDGASRTFTEAIQRHAGEASYVRDAFNALPAALQNQVLAFLKSL